MNNDFPTLNRDLCVCEGHPDALCSYCEERREWFNKATEEWVRAEKAENDNIQLRAELSLYKN